jgi:RNA polymerase sigma-70 factor, ECF subfamily
MDRSPKGWEDFVDRFLGLVIHVVNHSATSRGLSLTPDLRDDLVSDVFACILHDDMRVLRRFAGNSSLATYLTVIARRVIVRRLVQLKIRQDHSQPLDEKNAVDTTDRITRSDNIEEIEHALKNLSGNEATAVRMFHLEGKSYSEIGSHIGVPENSVGPLLSRARDKMRKVIE